MKLTQELIDQIQEAMLHTNLKGEIKWKLSECELDSINQK